MHIESYSSNVKINQALNEILEIVITILKNRYKDNLVSLVLGGSFGRGEGSYYIGLNNEFKLVNDLDIFIILKNVQLNNYNVDNEINNSLSENKINIKIDFIFIGTDELELTKPSQLNYDFKFGSKVIFGDKNILSKIKFNKNIKISNLESRILLNTRLWCYIGAFEIFIKNNINKADQFDILYQLSKSLIAIGESILIKQNKYTSSKYIDKLKNLTSISFNDELINRNLNLIIWGFNFKLKSGKENIPLKIDEFYFVCLNFYLNYYSRNKKFKNFKIRESFLWYRFKSAIIQLISFKTDGFKTMVIDYLQIVILKQILNKSKNIFLFDKFILKLFFNYKFENFDNLVDFVSKKRLNG